MVHHVTYATRVHETNTLCECDKKECAPSPKQLQLARKRSNFLVPPVNHCHSVSVTSWCGALQQERGRGGTTKQSITFEDSLRYADATGHLRIVTCTTIMDSNFHLQSEGIAYPENINRRKSQLFL